MMKHLTCLNCSKPVDDEFCPGCGQRTATHRIGLKSFLLHDVLHGVWHIERGILFTLKETLARPGQAATDYISGKRIRYYNVFYLVLLMIGSLVAMNHFFESQLPENTAYVPPFAKLITEHIKFILIGWVPFLAFNGYVIMDRMHLNFAEHLIVSGISLLGSLLFCFPWFFVDFLLDFGYDNLALKLVQVALTLAMVLYPVWTYVNAAGRRYKWWEYLWRFAIFYGMLVFEIFIFFAIVLFSSGGFNQFAHK